MDIIAMARAAGLMVLLDGRIGQQTYESVSGSLDALRRFGDAYATVPDLPAGAVDKTTDLLPLFERWAVTEGLPLDRSKDPHRTFVWAQTEQAWFGFQGFAALNRQYKRVAIDA